MSPKALGRNDILGAEDLPLELVEVPEWGGSVYARGLTGSQRAEYFASLVNVDGDGKVQTRTMDHNTQLACWGMCDAAGVRLFTETGDVDLLAAKSARALEHVAEVVNRLSGLGVKAAEEAKGNSDPSPS